MLFEKNIEPRCVYCTRYYSLGEEHGICEKKGPVSPGAHCRAFCYDPTRRVPPASLSEDDLPVFEEPENTIHDILAKE